MKERLLCIILGGVACVFLAYAVAAARTTGVGAVVVVPRAEPNEWGAALDAALSSTYRGGGYVYNAEEGLQHWRSALVGLSASPAKILNVSVLGGGIAAGIGATDQTTKGWVGVVRAGLAELFGDVGVGMVPSYFAAPDALRGWTYAGVWVSENRYGIMQSTKSSVVAGSTASLSFSGTGIGIVYLASNLCAKFSVSVDGSPPVEYDAGEGMGDAARRTEVAGLAEGDHTLAITQNEDGKAFILIGAYAMRGEKGIRVNMLGREGGTYGGVSQSAQFGYSAIDVWHPELTIVEFFTNEYLNQVALASYKAGMQSIVTRAKQFGDVLLVPNGIRVENKAVPQAEYLRIVRELSDENQVAMVDSFNRWHGSFSYANDTLHMVADTVHPNDLGHNDIGSEVLRVLAVY